MNTMIPEKLGWGWLRLALVLAQMGLVVAAVDSYLRVGFETITLLLVISATVTTIVSRHLYEGRSTPPREPDHPSG